ncbi:pectinesterase family protein [Natrialba aegyptia]|uniref:Pectinesterase n=1 Tax=Natrialba aegyptia DSM 13077 TaxID=1227491 RepID=M0AGM7_9EURY|nr:pectinesterase family protein [Natrialba aegyptia]ELY97724.1 Pectinesterase [Natrialba aegyptia DSM 13077]
MADTDSHSEQSVLRRRLLAVTGAGVLGAMPGYSTTGGSAPGANATAATDGGRDIAAANDSESTGRPDGDDYNIVVAQDGSGDYETVQAAINAVQPNSSEETRVYIKTGRYKEKLELPEDRINVTFVGERVEDTVLTYDDHADKRDENGDEIGTSGSSSFFVWGDEFSARNVTFENAAEPVAQAVAIRIDADRVAFDNCRFLGNQDTLYNFGRRTRQYFTDCYIEGDVDFIFGRATAFFDDCTVVCTDEGFIAAPAQPEDVAHGFVFKDCDIRGGAPSQSVYLGRPWEPYGQTVYIDCELGDHIRPVGWEPWDEPEHGDKRETAYFAEYDNHGPGYTPEQRADWSHQLGEDEAAAYTVETVLDGWDPRRCPGR